MINREEQKSVSPKRFCLSVTQKHTPAHWLYFFGGGGGGWMPCVGEGRGCMSTTILFIFLNSAPWLISLLPPGAFLSPSHTKKWNFPCCISVHLNHLNTTLVRYSDSHYGKLGRYGKRKKLLGSTNCWRCIKATLFLTWFPLKVGGKRLSRCTALWWWSIKWS